jgi:exonuclease III
VAVVIAVEFFKYVKEVIPISLRLMVVFFAMQAVDLHFIVVYMPAAYAPEEQKEEVYGKLEEQIHKYRHKGPIVVMGDMNARVHCRVDDSEWPAVGNFTFDQQSANPRGRAPESVSSRWLLVDCCEG